MGINSHAFAVHGSTEESGTGIGISIGMESTLPSVLQYHVRIE